MEIFISHIIQYIDYLFLTFAVIIFGFYFLLAVLAAFSLWEYFKSTNFVAYDTVAYSRLAPKVTVIAPAFNESKTIISNIHSLLNLEYSNFEIVVVNDGSTDDTLQQAITHFGMEKVDYFVNYRISCSTIRGIYKSTQKAFNKLTFVDKVNGGKGDALNAGINIASGEIFIATDVDSYIQEDAIQRMVRPFITNSQSKVIAVGASVRVANSCKFEDGNMLRINLPKKLLPKFQILEYTRAFLMARMGWTRINGLMLISGAMGAFDRNSVIEAGGYYSHTVGEDMELIVRLRRKMEEKKTKQRYKIATIPDPLCWTEVPESLKILGRQRNRWARGAIDSLFMHRTMFLNPKYRKTGLLSHPFWTIFEWLAPLIELAGLVYFGILVLLKGINIPFFLLLLAFVYFFSIFITTWALLFEELTFHRYRRTKDILILFGVSLIEPFIYHPLLVYWALRGNIDYLRGKKGWGKMTRKGFGDGTTKTKT